jgi:hypothetical protein
MLARNVQTARTLLRDVLEDPIKFTPVDDGFHFEGRAQFGRLLTGTAWNSGGNARGTNVASPRGHEEGRQWSPATFVVGVAA